MNVTMSNQATGRKFAFQGNEMTATNKAGRQADFQRVGKGEWENVDNGNHLTLDKTRDGLKGNPMFRITRPDETQAASGQLNIMA